MGKKSRQFVCNECGAVTSKWSGQCESCKEWNSIEEVADTAPKIYRSSKPGRSSRIEFVNLNEDTDIQSEKRSVTNNREFDRVTGGGLVPGSALLIGGDPGIGKSTLLLQIVAALANKGLKCGYVSGEEAIDQVRMRARRLGLDKAPVELVASTSVDDILATMSAGKDKPDIIVVDSIQTMYLDAVDSAPGTVTQVRAASHELIRRAKETGTTLLLVGHVTKEGQIAGPRVLEHMVDTVLYFEGDRGHQFRILRAVKNRFGPTDEIGVFEMNQEGLVEVENPSALFLSQRQDDVAGSAVLAALEGSRPVLVEVQALVAPTGFSTPRRAVIGWDQGRLAMITAVLEARCGLQLSGCDIYLNIAGGLRISEPAADLAVAAALISSLTDVSIPAEMVLFGEVGLAGEIRPVAQPDLRLKEASKLGFTQAITPLRQAKKSSEHKKKSAEMTIYDCSHVQDLISSIQNLGRKQKSLKTA